MPTRVVDVRERVDVLAKLDEEAVSVEAGAVDECSTLNTELK